MLQSQAVRMVRQHARPVSPYVARPALALLLVFLALVDGVGGPISRADAAVAVSAGNPGDAIELAADGPDHGPAALPARAAAPAARRPPGGPPPPPREPLRRRRACWTRLKRPTASATTVGQAASSATSPTARRRRR